MTSVTVFSTGPGCHKCLVTKTHLRKRGIEFEEVRMDQNPDWIDKMKALGHETAPVVLVGDEDVWSDYSGESIDALARGFGLMVA